MINRKPALMYTNQNVEFYVDDDLKPSALRLDQDFIAKME